MIAVKEPFILSLRRQATSGTTFTAKTEPWKSGDVVVITGISVCNETSNNKDIAVGVIRDEFAIYVETKRCAANGNFYHLDMNLHIPSDYRVIIKFINHADGDKFIINVFGYIETYCKE